MSTPMPSRLRIAADLFRYEDFSDTLRADIPDYIPKLRAGDAVQIELALFQDGTLLDISNVASLTLEIKPMAIEIPAAFDEAEEEAVDLRGPAYDSGLLLSASLTAPELYPALTQLEWDSHAADKAHAVFSLSAEQTRLAPGDRWLNINLLTNDSPAIARTVCAGRIRILGGGQSSEPA